LRWSGRRGFPSTMQLLGLKAKSSAKCRRHDRIFFFPHSGVRVRPAYQVRLCPELPAPMSAPATSAEILAGAAYSQRSSSDANSLCCAVGLTASPRRVWASGGAGIGISLWLGRASGVRSAFSRKEIQDVTVAYADDRRH